MENLTFKFLKVAMRAYGAIIFLVFGSYFIFLFAHDDVMLLKAPRHFEWIIGDVILLLIILWGFFFIISSFIMKKFMSLFCAFLASVISILVGLNKWRMEHLRWLGVWITLLLFLFPSLATIILNRAKGSLSEKRR